MQRRVQRRMQVNQIASLEEYREFLRKHPEEVQSLQKDLLISVTSFFRDPEHWKALQQRVVPALFEGKSAEDELRTWVVGTATGEEAYSLAILLLEQARSRTLVPDTIQVFATDIDAGSLNYARNGRYPESIAADVPAEYLDRYFVKEGTQYAVKDFVREHVLFTPHSLLRDPPFSNLDLISCRNLLIYLRRDLQTSVFDLFAYALNEDGYLFLGTSESAERADGDFQAVDASHRIYQLRNKQQAVPQLPSMPLTSTPSQFDGGEEPREPVPSEATVHQRLLEAHSPPSVVVNEDYRLLHLSDDAGRYLKHPSGTPRTNIVELVRPELQAKIRSVLHEAFTEQQTVQSQPVRVEMNGLAENVRLVAHPGTEGDQTANLVLVLFEQVGEGEPRTGVIEEVDVDGEEASPEDRLRAELRQTKKELRATVQQYESSQQELQAANEELRSMNEEYKSMTEELETSKEELQSVNEELKTVNQELEEKVEQLRKANSDLKNVMASTQIGTLFLDRELRIQRYTPRVEKLFNIRPEDEDRPIGEITHHLDYDRLEADVEDVLDNLQPIEREVRTDEGEWFLVRIHPYRTHDDRIDGVVTAFIEITDRRVAEQALRRSEEFHRLAVEAGQVGTWDLDLDSGESYISSMMAEFLDYDPDQFPTPEGHWQQVVPREAWLDTVHPEDRAAVTDALEAARETGEPFELQFRVRPDENTVRWLYAKGAVEEDDGTPHLHGATVDVTEPKEARAQLRAANERLRERTEQVQSLSEALTSAEERVRRRISRMLHDEVQQLLVGAMLTLKGVQNGEGLGDDHRTLIEEARGQIEEGVEVARTLSKELSPPVGKESLYDALEWLTIQMKNDYGLSVQMKVKGPAGAVDKPVRTLLFHTVRELLFNVVKHAEVDEAALFLVQGEDKIRVVVEDEGAGFDPSEIEEWTEGMGLAGLQERIGLIGGQVEIDTAPGEGTRIAFEVPRQTGETADELVL
jgi:two-component system CheB/CheR fusion protein